MGDDFENCELEICWQDGNGNELFWDTIPMINNCNAENYDIEINGLDYTKKDLETTIALEYDEIFKWIFCSRIETFDKALLKSNKKVKSVLKRNKQNED